MGRLETRSFASDALVTNSLGMAATRPFVVYLPPEYDTTANRFPVVYVLHYFGAAEGSLVPEVCRVYEALIGARLMGPVIFVFPDLSNPLGGTFGRNSPVNGDLATYLSRDLVEWMDANYRTMPVRESRGVLGYSHGANAAVHLGLTRPGTFGGVVGIAGYYDATDDFSMGHARTLAEAAPADFDQLYALPLLPIILQAYQTAVIGNPDKPWPFSDSPWRRVDGNWEPDPAVIERLASSDIYHGAVDQYAAQGVRLGRILLIHGVEDGIFPVELARRMHARLVDRGIDDRYLEHPGGHWFLAREALQHLADQLVGAAGEIRPCLPLEITRCPEPVRLELGGDCRAVLPGLTNQLGIAACNGPVEFWQTPPPGTALSAGVYEVQVGVRDASGESRYCSVTATVVDTAPPQSISPPAARTIAGDGECRAFVPDFRTEWMLADCDPQLLVTQDPPAGTVVGLGPRAIVLTARDSQGNATVQSTTLHVVDVQGPVIDSFPERIVIPLGGGGLAVLPELTGQVQVRDCSGPVALQQTPAAGWNLGLGEHLIEVRARDTSGNESTCWIRVQVMDLTAPVITACPAGRVVDTGIECRAPVPDLVPEVVAMDASGAVSVLQEPFPGTTLPVGHHVIRIRATDSSGNEATCDVPLDVVDRTAPLIAVCVGAQDLVTDGPGGATVPDYRGQLVIQGCSTDIGIVQEPAPGVVLEPGVHTLRFVATDASGNQAECRAALTVHRADLVITRCAPGITIRAGDGCLAPVPSLIAGVEVSAIPGGVEIQQDPAPGVLLPVGRHRVALTARDRWGGSASCAVEATVIEDSAPVIERVPPGRQVYAGDACRGLVPDFSDALRVTDCDSSLVVEQLPAPGTSVPVGMTTIVLVARDSSGNASSCTTSLEVVDPLGPVVETCPSGSIDVVAQGGGGVIPDLRTLAAFRSCTGRFDVDQVPPPGTLVARGDYLVRITARDDQFRSADCVVHVRVLDVTPPQWIERPAAQVVGLGSDCTGKVPDLTVLGRAEDDSGSVRIVQFPVAGSQMGPGRSVIKVTATDPSGNGTECEVTVDVVDLTPPEVTSCPADVELILDGDLSATLPDFRALVISTDCTGPVVVTQDPPPGSVVGPGSTRIQFRVLDGGGNANECAMTYRVRLPEVAILRCPPDVSMVLQEGCLARTPSLVGGVQLSPTSGRVEIFQDPPPGTPLAVGSHTITVTVRGLGGQTAECRVQAVVLDVQAPEILRIPDSRIAEADASCEAIVPDFSQQLEVTDCDSQLTIVQSPSPGTTMGRGVHEIRLTVRDRAGNESTGRTRFEVQDRRGPRLDPTSLVIVDGIADGRAVELPDLTSRVAAFSCSGPVTLRQTPPPGTRFAPGEYLVVISGEDPAGRTATTTVVYRVHDTVPPQFSECPRPVTLALDEECLATVPDLMVLAKAEDASGVVRLVQDPPAGTRVGQGTNVVRLVAWDDSGNSGTCLVEVRTVDRSAPVILACPGRFELVLEDADRGVVPDYRQFVDVRDCVPGFELIQEPPAGALVEEGAFTLRFVVTDLAGNATECLSTLDVVRPQVVVATPVTLDLQVRGSQLVLSFVSTAGVLHRIESCRGSLESGVWQSEATLSGTGERLEFVLPTTAPHGWLRCVSLAPGR